MVSVNRFARNAPRLAALDLVDLKTETISRNKNSGVERGREISEL